MRKTYRELLKPLVAVLMVIGILTSGMVRTEKVNAANSGQAWDGVINIAESEIGYKEKTGKKNKYAQFFDDLRKEDKNYYYDKKNGIDWCSIFVDWCFVQAYGYTFARQMRYKNQKFQGGASCSATYEQYTDKGLRGKFKPQKGDQIFFNHGHTGLVIDVTDKKVFTIEGNTKEKKTDTVNKVFPHSYDLTDPDIKGYGRPDYSVVEPYCQFIRALYLDAVGTGCSSNNLYKYVAKLGKDKISTAFEPVMWEIYNLPKVKALPHEEFVNRLYLGLLRRSPTDAERTYLVSFINYKDRRAALDKILDSKEWKDRAKTLGLNL